MGLSEIFKFAIGQSTSSDLPVIFNFEINAPFFVKADIIALYKKIFTDVIERTYGIKKEDEASLWDNCLANEASKGLLTLLSEAMFEKKDLFLTYKLNVLSLADQTESQKIKEDYKKMGESSVGIYVSFANYTTTDLLKIYSGMEYCILASLNKSMNLSKAIQIKISDLRKSISEYDKTLAISQAQAIATGLSEGKDIIIDAGDKIETAVPEMDSTQKAINFINQKKAFILGLPEAYITGEQTGGIGSSGENDMRAVERGLKNFYVSIIRPVILALFGTETSFKSQDFRQVTSALEALKTFELIGEDLISLNDKKMIVEKLLNIESEMLP